MSTAVVEGQTDVSLYFEAFNEDGSIATGEVFGDANTAYTREREEEVIAACGSLADQDSAHTDNGFIEVSAGLYRVDFPDLAFATGVKFSIPRVLSDTAGVYYKLCTNLIDIAGSNPRAASNTVGEIADGVWDEATAGHTTAGTFGKLAADTYALIDTEVATLITNLATLDAKVVVIDDLLDTEMPALTTAVAALPAATVTSLFAKTFHATEMAGLTFEQTIALIACGVFAKLSGAATTTVTIRNVGDTANAIVATVDADGNRTAITLTPASVS